MLLAATRARNGSVTSLHSTRTIGQSFSASAPRFQTTPIKYRGMTLEQAQWTLSSSELQSTVSKSIQSADPASFRLLPPEMLHSQLGKERQRLEENSSEIRTNYKLAVRKRRALLASLSNAMDAGEFQDQAALIRTTEELKEISDNMDRMSEELYSTTDQLAQLNHLEDVHNTSGLGLALRKLYNSFAKHIQDKATLRQRISELEAERDEGWAQAQEVAQELEAKDPQSKRASRVSIARKSSMRASKAGLRSPSRLRNSRWSGQSSQRNSSVLSPAVRSAYEEIPPVPPIPGRGGSLGIITSDLPIRSAGLLSSDYTPTSEALAMAEAQRELCEMLGIGLDELSGPQRRRVSDSDVGLGTGSGGHARRNSDVSTPARTKDEQRAAVLASIGMMYHEV
ncbi:hypothetical protein EUX98_g3692 [Antrodiella citrinella]|uniref:Uncharacterized protein n=1 Tax=Antrodiella citrinella TaxID=2447956 RepID=A0A4S4MXX8_9APHY|nr:hypothetical protein EUX98_g3692 [Antrodiella citrinella]